MAFAGAGRADQADVSAARIHSSCGEVVEGCPRHRGGSHIELLQGLGDREAGLSAASAGIGGVPSGDLGFDKGAEKLLGIPPLGLGGDQQLWGRAAASRPSSAASDPSVRSAASVGGVLAVIVAHPCLIGDLVCRQRRVGTVGRVNTSA